MDGWMEKNRWMVGWKKKIKEKIDGWLDGQKKIWKKQMDGWMDG